MREWALSSPTVSARPSMRAESMLARAGSPIRPATSASVLPETIVMAPSIGRGSLRVSRGRFGRDRSVRARQGAAVQPGEETA